MPMLVPRAGPPARKIPAPRMTTAATPDSAYVAPLALTGASRPSSSSDVPGSGRNRSRIGRAAQITTSPARSPTLVPNSSVCGAISRTLATATSTPKTTRPTRPLGTVLGSVIMKNRKIITSGEVTTTRQKSNPQTGANAQLAVMQWPGGREDAEPGS